LSEEYFSKIFAGFSSVVSKRLIFKVLRLPTIFMILLYISRCLYDTYEIKMMIGHRSRTGYLTTESRPEGEQPDQEPDRGQRTGNHAE
jgi:hypothetical protein